MNVNPPGTIGAASGARISHDGNSTIVITATNEDGLTETISVPPNTVVNWVPPAGWRSVQFTAAGHDPVFRTIDPSFVGAAFAQLVATAPKWNYLCVAATLATAVIGHGAATSVL